MKLNISELKVKNLKKLSKMAQFPLKYGLTSSGGSEVKSAPSSPKDAQSNQFTTADGAALAEKDPRKAKFFGLRLTK